MNKKVRKKNAKHFLYEDSKKDTRAVTEQPKTERGYGLASLFRPKI